MNDVINQISAIQNQIWQTVSQVVTEACGTPVTFASPLTVATQASEMYNEISAPMLVVQFAFAGMPDRPQVVLFPQDTFAELAGLIKNENIDEVDENLVTDVRSQLEAVVQGLCFAIGTVRNEPVVASGLSIRYQIFSFPPNLQRTDQMVRIQVAMSGDDLNGTAMWLLDNESAQFVVNHDSEVDMDEEIPFHQLQEKADSINASSGGGHFTEDNGGLDLLMDIPLEVSVELGRVKMIVRDVVELGTGSIVEIDKAAGEPVDVMVNGRLVARGEVVVIEDNFGVRITEILSAGERLSKLGEVA